MRVGGPDAHGVVTFHLGFVTPANQYAELEESNGDSAGFVAQILGGGTQQVGLLRVGDMPWQELRTTRGELALVRVIGTPTVVVTGSAKIAELSALAGAMR